MSLLLFNELPRSVRYTVRPLVVPHHSWLMDPLEEMERSMARIDSLFDNSADIQLRDHVGKLDVNKQSGELTYQVDVSGFRPEELKVELDGDEIVVKGEHKEQNQGESVHRQFVRRVLIPTDIVRESIRCDLDPKGCLCVRGKCQTALEQPQVRSIPIEKAKPGAGGDQQKQVKEGDKHGEKK